MAKSVSIRGSITAGSGPCCGGSGAGSCAELLELLGSCGDEGVAFTDVVTLAPVIATSGDIGQNFVRLGIDLAEVELLYVKSTARVRLRIDARPSTTLAVGGIYPTLFVGGEAVNWYLDQLPVIPVTFEAGDQSIEQVAARFNAAAALAGDHFEPPPLARHGQPAPGRAPGALRRSAGAARPRDPSMKPDVSFAVGHDLAVYSAAWCPDCTRLKRWLSGSGLATREIDIESVAGAAEKLEEETGKRAIPFVLVDGVRTRTVGRVSMDMTAIDLGAAPDLAEGDWLDVAYSLPEAARISGLSQYELLTLLGRRFAR